MSYTAASHVSEYPCTNLEVAVHRSHSSAAVQPEPATLRCQHPPVLRGVHRVVAYARHRAEQTTVRDTARQHTWVLARADRRWFKGLARAAWRCVVRTSGRELMMMTVEDRGLYGGRGKRPSAQMRELT